jgi:hypothetical protein
MPIGAVSTGELKTVAKTSALDHPDPSPDGNRPPPYIDHLDISYLYIYP